MIKYINNKIVKITAVALTLLVLSVSCEDILDQQPISEIGPKNFWKNNTDAASGVAAIYDGMQEAYSQKYFLWGEFRSDNHVQSSQGSAAQNLSELVLQDLSDGNSQALRWGALYQMINRANQAIKNIPTITGYDKNLLAEAYALRAFAYFDVTRVWGSAPLFTEPTEGIVGVQKPRTDAITIINEVVIPDMLKAEELMAAFSNDFRFSKSSILAMQAEVYMWLQDYDKAKIALDKIVALGEHSLVKTVDAWVDLFYNNLPVAAVPDGRGKIQTGPELMLSIKYDLAEARDNDRGDFANRSGIMGLFFAGIPSYYISPVLELKWQDKFPIDSLGWVTKYPDVDPAVNRTVTYTDENGVLQDSLAPVYGDWRYFACREGGFEAFGSRELGEARVAKWNQTNYNRNFDDTDIVLYRYSGMLLLLAEAENQLGNTTRALELVNEVRAARLLPLVTTEEFGVDTEARESYILDERQLELLGEAKRWWDLRRTNKAMEVLNPILDTIEGGVQLTKERLLFPVFIDHLIENPLLEQTPGY